MSINLNGNNTSTYSSSITAASATFAGPVAIGGTDAAHTIRDYERGTWTPKDKNGNNFFTFDTATYVKIGDLVFISFDITATASANGNEVTNLPFEALVNEQGGNFCFYNGLTTTTASTGGHTNFTKIVLYSGNTPVDLTNGDRLIMSGTYITND